MLNRNVEEVIKYEENLSANEPTKSKSAILTKLVGAKEYVEHCETRGPPDVWFFKLSSHKSSHAVMLSGRRSN